MSDFARWFLLFLTSGSLVQVAPTAMPRAPSCEEQLRAVSVDPLICEKIRLAASSVRKAVLDIDAKVRSEHFDRALNHVNPYREPRQEGLERADFSGPCILEILQALKMPVKFHSDDAELDRSV